ncbi:MAG: hypothetical protein Q9178_002491 [Gyalolechia marmorata]
MDRHDEHRDYDRKSTHDGGEESSSHAGFSFHKIYSPPSYEFLRCIIRSRRYLRSNETQSLFDATPRQAFSFDLGSGVVWTFFITKSDLNQRWRPLRAFPKRGAMGVYESAARKTNI